MAVTERIIANIYGKNGNALEKQGTTPNGRVNYFPYNGNIFYPAPAGTSFNGITCNSVIEVFPTGLNQSSNKFYAVETVAQLVTNGS